MNTLLLYNEETDEEVEVDFRITGGYSRASLYDPGECPEVEFENLPSWADEDACALLALEQAEESRADDEAEARAWGRGEDW